MPNAFSIPHEAMNGAVSIGNFDGVHLGHRTLVQNLKAMGKRLSGPAVVVTFDPPPLRLLRPDLSPKPLTTHARKLQLLYEAGVDVVVTLDTTADLLQLSAPEFFKQVVQEGLQAKGIIEGENFRFGKGRVGDIDFLRSQCEENQIHCSVLSPQMSNGDWISSTRIRAAVEAGELKSANQMLGSRYRISGVVGHGAERGRTLGFPTANLGSIPVLLPAPGVYCARVTSVSSRDQASVRSQECIHRLVALHIGPNPTFGEDAKKVEAHLLDFSGDLYGLEMELEIACEIRAVQKFDSKESLLTQLNADVAQVRAFTWN